MKMTILGAGYSGKAIAREALSAGYTVAGTTRSADKAAALAALDIETHLFDGWTVSEALAGALRQTTHLVQSIAPRPEGDPMLRIFGSDLKTALPALQWVGYLSTVGVYGDQQGNWVDEDGQCNPKSARSLERVEAENAWMAFGRVHDLPVAILRLAGIYGPGRNAFVNLMNGTARRLVKPGQVFNRIRVEDIGRATQFLAERRVAGIFNVSDDEPAPPQDIIVEAARLLGVTPPPEQPFEGAELTEMARSFYGENKRISNAKLRTMGFRFNHPDYRQSLADLAKEDKWRG